MSEIQAVIFNRKDWTDEQARKWLISHGLLPIKQVHKTPNYYRYRIKEPIHKFYTTKAIKNNMKLVIGYL